MWESGEDSPDRLTALVVNIQHFSTHDGPGIRSTVFLKGCSLSCKWCCNPESLSPKPELACNQERCIGGEQCGYCSAACPEGAILVTSNNVAVDRERCNGCGKCAEVCPTRALKMFGRRMTVTEVLAAVERDQTFYGESGGGLTLSGGECLLQPGFARALLAEARKRGLHTAIETAGNVPWNFMAMVLPQVDVMLHDFKLSDPGAHRDWTGADNRRILENYRRAYEGFPEVRFVARIPLIRGVNDDVAHVRAVMDFIRPYPNVAELELLPFHNFGAGKYELIGRCWDMGDAGTPHGETVARLRALVQTELGYRAAAS
ncbi:MAG: glycyl-radical enzyme activating protein [Alphaproteobacteria bacterium]|nr:glycyl-radical enzyme activating protein [Alphaproteobacteria bacterium]